MFPKYDTITNNPEGLAKYNLGLSVYKTLPSIINSNFNEGLSNEEIESIAVSNSFDDDTYIEADELGGGKKSIHDLGLDKDFLGNTLLRRSLGYLSEQDNLDIADFTEETKGNTRNNFLKVMRGKTDAVLSQLKQKEDLQEGDGDFQLYSYFTPAVDPETGKYTLKRVIGTKDAMAKVELAGASIINSYGPKKFSTNFAIEGAKGFSKGLINVIPGVYSFGAGFSDIVEASKNLLSGNGFKADYDALNALADYRWEEQTQDTMYGQSSTRAEGDLFTNPQSFFNQLANGVSSYMQYAGYSRALMGAGNLLSLGELGNALVNGSKLATNTLMFSSGMLLNFDEAYQATREAGLPLENAAVIGMITGALNTVLEMKLGSNRLMEWLATGKSGSTAAKAIIGEVGGDLSKLYNHNVSSNIVRKILNVADRVTSGTGFARRTISSAIEEGTEEFLQGMIKNSVESLYDIFIAPDDATKGKGMFGTKPFDGETIKSLLEEGAVGAIIGALGGVIHAHSKEDRSIIPFIAAKEFDSLNAGLNMAKAKGAISDTQYEEVKKRIDALTVLRKENDDLFSLAASFGKEDQLTVSEAILSQLRDQDDYIKNTKNGSEDNYEAFVKLLNQAQRVEDINGTSVFISTVNRFAERLQESGRNEEADIIKTARSSAKQKTKQLLPKLSRKATTAEKLAYKEANNRIEQTNYTIQVNRLLNKKRAQKAQGELTALLTKNSELATVFNEVENSSKHQNMMNQALRQLESRLSKLTAEDGVKASEALEEYNKFLAKHFSNIVSEHSDTINIMEAAQLKYELEYAKAAEIVNKKRLSVVNDSGAVAENIIKKTKEFNEQKEQLEKAIREIQQKAQNQKKFDDKYNSKEYKDALDIVINDETVDDATKTLYKRAKDGDISAQIEIIDKSRKSITAELNNTPLVEKEKRDSLKQQLLAANNELDYLKNKKSVLEEQAAKEKASQIPFEDLNIKDEDTLVDNNNQYYIIDRLEPARTVNDKIQITVKTESGDTKIINEDTAKDYTVVNGTTRMPLTQKFEFYKKKQDKGINQVKDDNLGTSYEPVGNKLKLQDHKDIKHSDDMRLAASKAFEAIINNPKTDVSKFKAVIQLSENIENQPGYKNEKASAILFNRLLNETDPLKAFNELSEDQRGLINRFLPIQVTIPNKGYKNVLYSFSNYGEQKSRIIALLLSNGGKIELEPGHIFRTPGYINYIEDTNNSLVKGLNLKLRNGRYVLPDGSPLVIGIADATKGIKYTQEENGNVIIKTANAEGTPGSPFLVIPGSYQLTGEEGYVAKLNPTKISESVANAIANIFADIAAQKIKLSDTISDNNPYGIDLTESGYLTYGKLLGTLIFFGDESVNKNGRGNNKELFYDQKQHVWKYGSANDIINPNSKESIQKFSSWIKENKNYALSRGDILNNKVVEHGFTIGDVKFETGKSYLTSIVDNNFLHTDLDISQGLITKSYLTVSGVTAVVTKKATEQKVEEKNKAVKAEKNEDESAQQKVVKWDRLKFESADIKTLKEDVLNLPDGSIISSSKKATSIPQEIQDEAAVIKQGDKIVDKDGKVLLDLKDLTNEDISVKLRKLIIDRLNKLIDAHNKPIQNVESEANKLVANISTMTVKANSDEAIEDKNYHTHLKTLKVIEGKPVKTAVELKKTVEVKEKTVITNSTNPFASLPQTEEIKKFSEIYDKLYNYLSSASSEDIKRSALNNIRLGKTVPSGITKEDLTAFLEFDFDDGTNPFIYLSKVEVKKGKPAIEPIVPNKKVKPIDKPIKPVSTNDTNIEADETSVQEPPVQDAPSEETTIKPSTGTVSEAQRLLDQIGVSTLERKKPKVNAKFGNKPKNPSVPMTVGKSAVSTRSAEQEVRNYRRLLSKSTGGKVEIVDKLIEVLGESGRPGWAWALMHQDGVTLFEKPAAGVLYHEAFHRVSLLLLSPTEHNRLYYLARKEYNLYGKSDIEIEEYLAERFREYVLNSDFEKQSGIKRFFSNIANFIKTFLGLNKTKIENIQGLFKAIKNGKYKYAKVNEAALSKFNLLYAKQDIPLTVNNVVLYNVGNSAVLSNIVNQLTAMLIDTNGIQDIESLKQGLSFKPVLDYLIDVRDRFKSGSENTEFSVIDRDVYLQKTALYNEIIDNFNTVFRPLIDTKLQGYNIRKVESNLDEKDDLNDLVNDEVRSAYEFSSKENSQADVRIMFLTLRKSNELDPDTFLPQYQNPDVAWYNTFSLVHNANSIDEMLELLVKQSEQTNSIRQALGNSDEVNMYSELYNILTITDEDGNADEMLKTRFWNTFKKHRNNFINAYFRHDTTEKGKALDTYEITFGDADINKRSKKIEQNWSSLFGVNQTFRDKDLLEQAINDYSQLKKESKTKNFANGDYEKNVSKLVRILNSVGIRIDNDTIGILLNKYFFDANPNVSLRRLINGEITFGKTDPVALNQLFGEKGLFHNIIYDNIEDIDEKALKLLQDEKSVRELAKAYVDANPTAEDDSVIGPDGNLVYAYSEHNTITSIFEEWLKDEGYFNQLRGVTYSESSVWLKQMEDPTVRDAVHVDTMLSMIATDEYDTGRGYLEIAPNENLLLKFNALMNNKMLLPTLANKRTYYFISGLKRVPVSIQNGKLNKEIIDVFVNYALNEYKVIQEAIKAKNNFLARVGVTEDVWNNLSKQEQDNLLKEKNTNYTDLVENYHYIIKKDSVKLIGNGYKFRYFTSLSDKLNNKKLFNFDNKVLRGEIEKALIQQVNNTIKLFINQKLISGNIKYADEENIKEQDNEEINTKVITGNLVLSKLFLKSKNVKQDLAQLIADYALNSAINILEFEKIVSGDVAYYKGSKDYKAMLDDRVKRYSALTSTKSVLREDFPHNFVDFDTHSYNTAIFSSNIVKSQTMYDVMMQKYVGTDEEHGIMWKQLKRFRDEKRGKYANMTDEQLKEAAVEESDKRLRGYLETDQTDAQVLISPKMFRKLSIMNGEWTAEKEVAYELMESDKELTLDEELEAYSVIMQPLKYIHFGYDFFNGLQVPIYDKMSLATVFKRVAKGRDLQKVYDLMNDNDIDMIKFDTAVKSGLRQKGTFYLDGEPNSEINEIPVYKQQFKYLGKQLVTDPHHVSRIAMGTQMAKIGVAGVEDSTIYEHNGQQTTGRQLISDYIDAIKTLSNLGKSNIESDFGIHEVTENGKTYITVNREKFTKMLHDDAISSNMPANLIDSLQIMTNENGEQEYYVELSNLPALTWIQSRIISMIKKETIDVNTPGGAMIQMSNFAYKNSMVEVDVKNYNYKTNKELRFKNEDNRLEAIVSINLFKDVLPKEYLLQQAKKNNTTYFEEAREFILHNKDLAVLSYRIPTQGMNSTLPIEIVDVLPENVGDTIVLPAELTKLTGADFDVDKMYLARYNYNIINGELVKEEFIDDVDYVDENGNVVTLSEDDYLQKVYDYKYRHYDSDFYEQAKNECPKIFAALYRDAVKNNGLSEEGVELLQSTLQKYGVFFNRREIRNIQENNLLNDTQKILQITETFKTSSKKESFENFKKRNQGKSKWELNSSRQIENRLLDVFQTILTSDNHYMEATVPLDFATDALKEAVTVVDSYSNINNNYADTEPLFPLYQEGVKVQNVGADAGIGPMALINTFRVIMQIAKLDLDKSIQLKVRRDNKTIERNLFSLIPVIGNLYDKFDSDGISIMDWTSALINAHVDAAKDSYITRLNVNSYTYDVVALLTSAGVGINQFYFLPQTIIKEIADESIRRNSAKIGLTKKEKNDKTWIKNIVNKYASNAKLPKGFYEKLDSGTLTIDWNGETYLAQDLIFNPEWLKEQMANHHDKNLTPEWYRNQVIIYNYFQDIQSYSKALSSLVLASQVDTGKMGKNEAELILSKHNIERVLNDIHFLNVRDIFDNTFLGEKLNNSTGLLFDLLRNESIEFSDGFLQLINLFGTLSDTYYDRKTNNINKYISELKFAMQSEFFNQFIKENNISLKEMFYGNNTLVDRVDKLRNKVLSGQEYYELANNAMLKMLIPSVIQEGKPKKFETSLKMRDTESKNAYTYAWRDLLTSEHKEVRDIARDLLVYSFYTSGGKGTGIYATLDLVPFEVLGNLTIGDEQNTITYNQFMKNKLNNSNNGSLDFKKYLTYAFKALADVEAIVQDISNASGVGTQKVDGEVIYLKLDNNDYSTTDGMYLPYLKYNDSLYQLVGEIDYTPVYALTNKINYKEKGFTINEGTSNTMFEENGKDYTDCKTEMSDAFLNNGKFIKYDTQYQTITSISDYSEQPSTVISKLKDLYEVSTAASKEKMDITKGDARFSAFNAKFKPGTVIDGVDVSGKSIEDVYQTVIKKSGKGKAPNKTSKLYNETLKTKEEQENFSYYEGYLPLWQEWAKQNPELIEELRKNSKGKTLHDKFANTRVSQARALTDILNDPNISTVNELSELGKKRKNEC